MAWSLSPWVRCLLPSCVTYLRPIGVGCALLLGFDQPHFSAAIWAALLFVLSYWYFDLLDGWLARRLGVESRFGECSDLYVDRLCDAAICIYLILHRDDLVLPVIYLMVRLPGDAAFSGSSYPSDICRIGSARLGLASLGPTTYRWLLRYAHITRTVYFVFALVHVTCAPVSIALAANLAVYQLLVLMRLGSLARDLWEGSRSGPDSIRSSVPAGQLAGCRSRDGW